MTEWVEIGGCRICCGDNLDVLRTLEPDSIDSVVTDPPAGISFMGKDWDHSKGGRDAWIAWMTTVAAECLRALKAGGHALVWSLPRTSHWTATAWEDAGFELRDRIAHCFGSGFPKSHNISIAIDKAAGAEREVVGEYEGERVKSTITAPATDAAKQWDGWGTALKPAIEDWWLMRKPLTGTVAQNVLQHGVGGINIDACRIEGNPVPINRLESWSGFGQVVQPEYKRTVNTTGRWPANIIHDGSDEVIGLFPESAGQQGDLNATGRDRPSSGRFGDMAPPVPHAARNDSGSAARFFYAAKASRADRDEGCGGMPLSACGMMEDDSFDIKTGSGNSRDTKRRNTHPTVKPQSLMRYLCRLITPPGGIVLDPFSGSFSTAKACVLEGFRFIGCDQSQEYVDIGAARIRHAVENLATGLFEEDKASLAPASSRKPKENPRQTQSLFDEN